MNINILRYGAIYAVATLVLSALPGLLNMQAAGGVTAALPPMIGAIIEGQAYVKAHGARAAGAVAWRGTLIMTAVALAFNAILLALANIVTGGAVFDPARLPSLLGLFAIITLIQFALNRLGLRIAPTAG